MPDIEHIVRSSRLAPTFDSESVGFSVTAVTLSATAAFRIKNCLMVESRAPGTSIVLLTDHHVEINNLLRYLKSVLSASGDPGLSTS